MKKYLLTVFFEKTTPKELTKIAFGLAPMVDSLDIKYSMVGDNASIFQFNSEVESDNLQDFIVGLLYDFSDTFVLTDITEKNSVKMTENLSQYLLDTNGKEVVINESFKNLLDEENIHETAEEFISILLEEIEKEIPRPSLNDILDKIVDKGMDSLTELEKQYLDEYSKK
jgi:hypothetical protein